MPYPWSAGNVLTATDLNSSIAAKAAIASPTFTTLIRVSDGTGTVALQQAGQTLYVSNNNAAADVQFYLGGTERVRLSASGLISGSGLSLGAWTGWTPVISGTGWALGNGTATGSYCRIGRMIHFRASIVFGSTSTFGTGSLYISTPVTIETYTYIVNGMALDVSAANYHELPTANQSNVLLRPQAVQSAAGLIQDVISTKPFTWASGDCIFINGTTESAT